MRIFYYRLLDILIRIPFIRKVALSFYIQMWAHRRKLRKGAKHSLFILYEPRFENIVRELEERGINVLLLSRSIFDYLFRKHLIEYIKNNKELNNV